MFSINLLLLLKYYVFKFLILNIIYLRIISLRVFLILMRNLTALAVLTRRSIRVTLRTPVRRVRRLSEKVPILSEP